MSEINQSSYLPAIAYAGQAYCVTPDIISRDCGIHCQNTPNLTIIAAGGDGAVTPGYFIGFDNSSSLIVVAHQVSRAF